LFKKEIGEKREAMQFNGKDDYEMVMASGFDGAFERFGFCAGQFKFK
jgi:hypothetical protein